ncbi:hypothetical protein ACTMU2_01915 [Cupriavidus basilensis]
MEAARYANPLTFLPGNIPLNQHIERLIEAGNAFHACYVDLNHFKSYNDASTATGKATRCSRGAAAILTEACDPASSRFFWAHRRGRRFPGCFCLTRARRLGTREVARPSDASNDAARQRTRRQTAPQAASMPRTATASRLSSRRSRWRQAWCFVDAQAPADCSALAASSIGAAAAAAKYMRPKRAADGLAVLDLLGGLPGGSRLPAKRCSTVGRSRERLAPEDGLNSRTAGLSS